MNKAKAQIRGFKVANWRQTVGLVCLAALPGAISQAYAFGLGHAKVKSALGQPLRADIDITQITADEASSLKVGVAPASAFQSRNLNYSSILPDVTVTLEHRPDGQPYLRLTSSHPVQDAFVDVLLRAYWANGELTRDYTLLFDPPNFQEPQPATSIAPQAGPQVSAGLAQPATVAPAAASAAPPAAQRTYTVRKGDTLSSIARGLGIETVSLDQMLTALYRANSGAFIDRNMNLLRAGAVLRIPSAEDAQSIPQKQAQQVIVAQSRSFEAYRRRLAEMTGQAAPKAESNARQASGKIQAEVQEPTPAASMPKSQLKLGQAKVGAAQGLAAQASLIAAQKQAEATAKKLNEAKANVAALSQLAASASAAVKAAATSSPAAAAPASAPAAKVPAALSAAALASTPKSVASVSKPALQVPLTTAAPKPATKQPSVSERGWFASLLANPLFAPAAAVIALLLAAWVFLRRRAQSRPQRDSSVFDSRLSAADSFFGGTGGERVDTRNSTLGSSVAYTPSQLDSSDVDPVAEADVYLAYGRDLQAEEILKESLKNHPDRSAARLKLLEIYAKRKDVRSFEMTAAEVFALTEGVGPDWKKAQDLGRNLDPVNPLYHNTMPPSTVNAQPTIPASDFAPTGSSGLTSPATQPATELLTSLPSIMGSATPGGAKPEGSGLDLNLDLVGSSAAAPRTDTAAAPARASDPVSAPPAAPAAGNPGAPLNFDFSSFQAADASASIAQPEEAHPPSRQPLEFDLGSLSLDLPASGASTPPVEPVSRDTAHAGPLTEPMPDSSDDLDTRLALVAECRAMGDLDTARNLLREIIAESGGEAKARAEKILVELG
ncbi:MAG: FimV family protein [Proteobacteria bacterium]|nr:FimV family protein [Pseudomonadota bacterium]